ncbi:MAG: hypothetical protein CMP65_03430 [Flavobacteriales bacterium]|nr:hypothetical protein [Flavobacteriales bacterium]|tara:strand:+ start:1685 stop:2545 length:861 start_codon:yes stop_codon:yes gene_type:complete
MISMTGYARNDININNANFTIYVKSLNSQKGLDLSIKMPTYLLELEHEIKKVLGKKLIRGKVELKIIETYNKSRNLIAQESIANNISTLKTISPESDPGSLLNAAILFSGTTKTFPLNIDSKYKNLFLKYISSTIDDVVSFRIKEGKVLTKEIKLYLNSIIKKNKKLIQLDQNRKLRKKNRLLDQIKYLKDDLSYNETRLESEMIYYLEKYDISEERTRLDCHCNYFLEILNKEKIAGKKLIFLSQEILREINTISSKANDFEIQKIVVDMKENIDKIKEQLYNTL